jgi:hypothetical protein
MNINNNLHVESVMNHDMSKLQFQVKVANTQVAIFIYFENKKCIF